MEYLNENSPEAFIDWVKIPRPTWAKDDHEECPTCKGHGGWNLQVNAYPLRGEDTRENRHLQCHFRSMCNHCRGYGWILKGACRHVLNFYSNIGRCYNRYRCEKCKVFVDIDSSD